METVHWIVSTAMYILAQNCIGIFYLLVHQYKIKDFSQFTSKIPVISPNTNGVEDLERISAKIINEFLLI